MAEALTPNEQMQRSQPYAEALGSLSACRGLWTEHLLMGGILAGPLFLIVAIGQMVFRAGFDPKQHPISLLSVGAGGWAQITNSSSPGP